MRPKQVTNKYHCNRLLDLLRQSFNVNDTWEGSLLAPQSGAHSMGAFRDSIPSHPGGGGWGYYFQIFDFEIGSNNLFLFLTPSVWHFQSTSGQEDSCLLLYTIWPVFFWKIPIMFLCSIMSVENLDNKSSEMTNSSHRVSRTGGQHLPKWLCHRCRRCHRHRHSGTTSSSWSLLSSLSLSQ